MSTPDTGTCLTADQDRVADALALAAAGYSLVRLHSVVGGRCTCGVADCPEPGAHRRQGASASGPTADPEVIRGWFAADPLANVGLATGAEYGVVAIVVPSTVTDPRAEALFAPRLDGETFEPLAPPVVTGPDGARVALVRHPGRPVPDRMPLLDIDGVEARGEGGYVPTPPSTGVTWTTGAVPPAPSALPGCGLLDADLSRQDAPADVTPGEGRYYHLTDLGNARRLVHAHGQDLAHSGQLDWHYWDGHRWRRNENGEVMRLAKRTVSCIEAEACAARERRLDEARARLAEDGDTEAYEDRLKKAKNVYRLIHDWETHSESESRLKSMLQLATTEREVVRQVSDFDRDPWVINVANGTIDLRTGELRAHRRSDYCTRIARVEYHIGAECPRWRRFLDTTFSGDRELIDYMQRVIGYCLTGATSEQVFFIFLGPGANGKGVIVSTVMNMLGDYSAQAEMRTFLLKNSEVIRNDLARLRGVRFVSASEVTQGSRLDEGLVKTLTGGDIITARFLYREYFQYLPAFKIILQVNHLPDVRATDHGFWRRVRVIPFNNIIPKAQQDPQLVARLRDEWPGILNWAIEGCLAWQRDGLGRAEAVSAASRAYRAASDQVGRFIDERCVRDDRLLTPASDLYRAYEAWAKACGEKALTKRDFGVELGRVGLKATRTSGERFWVGIGAKAE